MKAVSLAMFSTLALVMTSISAQAIIEKLHFNENVLTFSKLALVDPNTKNEDLCQSRYGSIFKTTDHPESNQFSIKRTTDQGHDITVISRSIDVRKGIFFIESQYEVIFPQDTSKTPIILDISVTGLIGAPDASGLFSDGTCRGAIHVRKQNTD
ncbi:hypothetical protein [Pseudovibrio brasiliensis]|uniref:Uncharacterized protein n=1 Tax=Pseudovibrio brasiliensis TaxID=1898042 RepID=A0ABX8AGE4_9HYPH|nr:hypothetical protein [Pseudovibrio brasiliensis]QUS54109.1 hypothetical protein KGB56_11785 [Pseudovibrio brasiliensis]